MAIYKEYKENNGFYNMAYDSALLEEAIKEGVKTPIIRFYGWSPKCVSLGRNRADSGINKEFCRKNNIDIVRRITGGRALLHDDEVTYSFICPVDFLNDGISIQNSYKEISSAIIEGFKLLDINLSFGGSKNAPLKSEYCMLISTGADLVYENKKIIGSAQFRTRNYLLQHGSVLFSYDKTLIENIFNEHLDTEKITCLSRINSAITRSDAVNAMKKGFNDYFNLPCNC